MMIVTRTPLRVSFLGGGSDIPQFYEKVPGLVISTTIDKCIKIAVNRAEPRHVRVVYSKLEQAPTVDDIRHTRAKAVLKRFGVQTGIEVASFSDITTRGSGLGSSSTYTVGLINAMYAMGSSYRTRNDLAELACRVEIEDLGEPIGKQDQYAATYGGFNAIRFYSDGVDVIPLNLCGNSLETLNYSMMCFSTGVTRNTSDILKDQVKGLQGAKSIDTTSQMVDIAEVGLRYIRTGRFDDFGALLHESWQLKKGLASGISNPQIDEMYELGMNAGALGGKILGAGGGGYMLFYVPERSMASVRKAMRDYTQFYFKFTDTGSEAIRV